VATIGNQLEEPACGLADDRLILQSAVTSLLCALAGANFIHNATGLMESALAARYEKYVIDNEMLGMVMRVVEGIKE